MIYEPLLVITTLLSFILTNSRYYLFNYPMFRMNRRIIGIFVLCLGILVILIGALAIALSSLQYAGIYLLVSTLAFLLITAVFCARCPVKGSCVHLLPGLIARLWPDRTGPYSKGELVLTVILSAVIILPPQLYLFITPGLFPVFWIFISAALICTAYILCPECGHRHCPMCKGNKEAEPNKSS